MSLIAELKRRRVFKVGAAYVVVAWLAIQAVSIGFPAFDAPPWILRVFILVALLGFPVALVFAWAFDVTSDGVKADAGEGRFGARSGKLIVSIAIALAALAFLWYFKGQPTYRAEAPPPVPPVANADATKSSLAEPAVPISAKSIAVLPFTDLSPSHDQEYFSDGMSEELLNALAKVKDLKVAGRTSSFLFKGKNEDMRVIGKTLGVANILEGSVRKQGDKVRITAQLIQASDGFHLWSDSYDGDLKDVFELQERIARSITDALKVVLVGEQQQRLVPVATNNPEAHALFLKATTTFNRRDGTHFLEAIAQLQEAIRLDPNYARAYARLAALCAIAPTYTTMDLDEAVGLTESNARKAIDLDPSLAEPYAALSFAYSAQRRHLEARPLLEHAVALDQTDVTAQFWFGTQLINSGYTAQGNAQLDRTLTLDPLLPNALGWRGLQYVFSGQLDLAQQTLQKAVDVGLSYADQNLAALAHAQGRDTDAIALYARGSRQFLLAGFAADASRVLAEGIYGTPVSRGKAIAMIDAYLAAKPKRLAGVVPYALLMLGEPQRSLSLAQEAPTSNEAALSQSLWSPDGRTARRLPQFPEFARRVGLADLWDKYGPPDTCRRHVPGDYVCE